MAILFSHLMYSSSRRTSSSMMWRRLVSFSGSSVEGRRPRLAITHSSYLPGLLNVLRGLQARLGGCDKNATHCPRSIIPGRISRTRGRRNEALNLSLTTSMGDPQSNRHHKALARKGSMVQEIFFVGGDRKYIEEAMASQRDKYCNYICNEKQSNDDDEQQIKQDTVAKLRTIKLIQRLRHSGKIK